MIIFLLILIFAFDFGLQSNNFIQSNYKSLVDHSRSSNPNPNFYSYSDSTQKFPYSTIQPSTTYKQFIATGKVIVDSTMNTFTAIMQIYRYNDPRYKYLHFGYDDGTGTLFVRQAIGGNPYCDISFSKIIKNLQIEFIISMLSTSSLTTITAFFRFSDGTSLQNQCVQTVALQNPFSLQHMVSFTDFPPNRSFSPKDDNFLGTIYRGYIIQESYIDNTYDQYVQEYIYSLNMYSQEGLSFLSDYYPTPDQNYVCIPDESSNKSGCASSTNPPTFFRGYSIFAQGQFFTYENLKVDAIYYSYEKYTAPLFLTISFWLNVAKTTAGETIPIVTWSFYNNQFLKVFCSTTVGGFQLQFIDYLNNQSLITTLLFDKFYFVTFNFNSYVQNILNVIVISYDGILTTYQFSISTAPSFRFKQGSLVVGESSSTFAQSFKLSQLKVILTGSVLFEPRIVDTPEVIKNCQIVAFRQQKYECLACKINYFLYQNQCIVQCDSLFYEEDLNIRKCIKKCSYKCNTCSIADPNICTGNSCSSSTREYLNNCRCKSGYEDLLSSECFQYRRLIKDDIQMFDRTIKVQDTYQSNLITFDKPYLSPPKVIISIIGISNSGNFMKGAQTQITSITTTNFSFDIKGSYLNTPINYTQIKLKILVYPSTYDQFSSTTFLQSTPSAGDYFVNINKGTYNTSKYGQHRVILFVSGIYFGQTTTYTKIRANYQLSLIDAQQTVLKITVNSFISQIQVSYIVLPDNLPYIVNTSTFNANSFYQDTLSQYYQKYYNKYAIIGNMANYLQNIYSYQSFYGISTIDMDMMLDCYYEGQYLPRFNQDEQIEKISFDNYMAYKYESNGLYLLENFSSSDFLCTVKDYYSQICAVCVYNRIFSLISFTCVCPDPAFIPYPDEIRCSYTNTAVLNVELSTNFDLLQIDFGLNIFVDEFTLFIEQSYQLCQHIFTQQTINLIGLKAQCRVFGKIILVSLDSDAVIKKNDVVSFKNIIRFSDSPVRIVNYFRTTVQQGAILYTASADIQYEKVVQSCDPISIQIKQFLNFNKRGVTWSWSIVSITPSDLVVTQNIQNEINNTNTAKNKNLYFLSGLVPENTTVQLKLQYNYDIGISGQQVISFQCQNTPKIEIKIYQTTPQPYYRKDELEIFFDWNYYKCDSQNNKKELFPATFDIQIDETTTPLSQKTTQYALRSFSYKIPSYKLLGDQKYDIKAKIQLVENASILQEKIYQFQIQSAPLLVFIDGGNIMHDYFKKLTINSFVKDLDLDPSSQNQTSGVVFSWSCLSLETQKPCVDIEDQLIPVPQGQTSIEFAEYTFIPYSTACFILSGVKGSRSQQSQIIVQFIDSMIPSLSVALKENVMLDQRVNMNDIIEATLNYDPTEDVNNLFFAGVIIYEKKVQKSIVFDYGQVRFQIWNYFSQFKTTNNKFQIKFIVFNPKYSMPSQSILTFYLNFPPQNCKLSVSPLTGLSLQTLFTMQITQCEDADDPITYKFFIYQEASQYQFEVNSPLQIQRKQLTDQQIESTLITYLPPGNLLLLVQAIDSKNAIFNMTQSIQVDQSVFDQNGYVTNVNTIISYAQQQSKSIKTLILSLLASDMVSRPAFYSVLSTQANQIVSELQQLTNTEYVGSTFCTLASQSISQLAEKNIQNVNYQQLSSHLNYVADILNTAQIQLPAGNQFEIDKQNHQLYNSFKILDGVLLQTQQTADLSQTFVQNSEKLGRLLNLDALPNESYKVFNGDNFHIASQVITNKYIPFYLNQENSKQNWESLTSTQNQDPANQIYDVSFKSYTPNIYQQQKPFQSFLAKIEEIKPNFKMLEYKSVNPSMTLHQDSTDITLNSQIRHSFEQKKDESLTCINQINKEWTTSGCKSVYNKIDKVYNCLCNSLSPVTVVNDIADLFDENENFKTIFSDDGISNILDFDGFYKYVAFWGLSFITLSYIGLSIYGITLDKIMSQNKNPVFSSNKIYPSTQSSPDIKSLTNKQESDSEKLDTIGYTNHNLAIKNNNITNKSSITTRSLQAFNEIEKNRKQKSHFDLDIKRALKNNLNFLPNKKFVKMKEVEQKNSQPQINEVIEEEQEKLKVHNNDQENQSHRNQSQSSGSILQKADTQASNENKEYKKLKERSFLRSLLYFHDFFSIFYLFDPNLNRFTRLSIIYIKNLHIFTSNIVFNQSYSIVQTAFLQLFNIITVVIISKFMELGLVKNNILSLIGFYYYAFLAVVSGKPPSSTNSISLIYFITLGLDIFLIGILLSIVFRQISLYLLNSTTLSPLKQKIFDLIKLYIILQNIDF